MASIEGKTDDGTVDIIQFCDPARGETVSVPRLELSTLPM
jgi:hypothetical protein